MSATTHIFLLIGLTRAGKHWDDGFIDALKKIFKTEKLTLVDLPGAGDRRFEKCPLSIEKIVESTRAYYLNNIDKNDINILISISLGGMVGSSWVNQYPEDFKKFVMINSSAKNLSKLIERVQPAAIKNFFEIFLAKDKSEKESKIINLCSNNKETYTKTHKKWSKMAEETPMTQENVIRQLLAGARYSLTVKPPILTYVIASKKDRLASYKCSENIAKFFNCESYFFEEEHIGHGAHMDAPTRLAEVIYNWAQRD